MKILYVTTVGGTMRFFPALIEDLIKQGHTVDIACSQTEKVWDCYREWGCKIYPLSCSRSPFKKGNVTAIKEIKKLVKENQYDLVHCHTPIAAACTRLACKKLRKQGLKVFYTAHGFHFYKGAPRKNWILYYPVEKLCARWTDLLITINQEDYALAQKKLKAKKVVFVPGVGLNVEKFSHTQVDKAAKRQEIGVPMNATMLMSVGELSERKNHQLVFRAIAKLQNPNIHYAIAGKGAWQEKLESLAKELGIEEQIHLLGYRTDVAELYKTADMVLLPSFHEGLPVALMEAMACGVPCAVSEIRGSVDLVDEKGGAYFDPHSVDSCAEAISNVIGKNCEALCRYNQEKIKNFSTETVIKQMNELYGV